VAEVLLEVAVENVDPASESEDGFEVVEMSPRPPRELALTSIPGR
jgi:hypothetical protein